MRNRLLSLGLAIGIAVFGVIGAACSSPDGDARTQLRTIAAPGSAESHLATGPDGTVVMSWLEPARDEVALRYSVLEVSDWSEPRTIAASDSWFVNWADFPSVVPMGDGLWGAHWLAKKPGGTFAYDVAVAVSTDHGLTWTRPVTPHDDDTATEHGFVSLYPMDAGVGALWLDGRNMVGGHGTGGMTLRSAVITVGAEITAETTDSRLVDELVCDCCQTDVAIGPDGPIAAYRDRTEEEIRDIYVTRFADGAWQPGIAVANDGWRIAGCPVNGPAISAQGENVVVAWFTAADGEPRVRIAWSSDGARSFGDATDVDLDGSLGRVGVLQLEDGNALVSWLRDADGGEADIRVARIRPDGVLEAAATIATTGAGRLSGFPQMTLAGDRVVFSWTDTADEQTIVRSALIAPALLFDADEPVR